MLPTLEHELVDSGGAVHRSRKPEGLVDRLHDLKNRDRSRMEAGLDLKYIYDCSDRQRVCTDSC